MANLPVFRPPKNTVLHSLMRTSPMSSSRRVPSGCLVAFLGPFPPPALPGLNGTMTPSDSRLDRRPGRRRRGRKPRPERVSPVAHIIFPACHAHYPGGSDEGVRRLFAHPRSLPRRSAGCHLRRRRTRRVALPCRKLAWFYAAPMAGFCSTVDSASSPASMASGACPKAQLAGLDARRRDRAPQNSLAKA